MDVNSIIETIKRSKDIMLLESPCCDVGLSFEESREVVIVYNKREDAVINLEVLKGAKLSIVNIFTSQSKVKLNVNVAHDSLCNITAFDLAGAQADYNISLNETGANVEINTLQLTTDRDSSVSNITIRHEVSDCSSYSLSKCVAAGESRAEFHGLVYVAKDAQRTVSEQNSRNIQLSDGARIISEPQLEIYADDVKCTHGSTIGQMNDEAIFYMMQRGLGREAARKLHLEGFVDDIVNRCSIAPLIDELKVLVEYRVNQI